MDNQNTSTSLPSNHGLRPLIPWLRLLGGAVLGFLISFFLIGLNNAAVNVPLLGPILAGQVQLFSSLFFDLFYPSLGSALFMYDLGEFVCSALWALVGALLLSGQRVLRRIGVVLLILYLIVGFLAYVFWSFVAISN